MLAIFFLCVLAWHSDAPLIFEMPFFWWSCFPSSICHKCVRKELLQGNNTCYALLHGHSVYGCNASSQIDGGAEWHQLELFPRTFSWKSISNTNRYKSCDTALGHANGRRMQSAISALFCI